MGKIVFGSGNASNDTVDRLLQFCLVRNLMQPDGKLVLQSIEHIFDWAIPRLVWRSKEQTMATLVNTLVNNMTHQGICMR
jgi:hypothetical protein